MILDRTFVPDADALPATTHKHRHKQEQEQSRNATQTHLDRILHHHMTIHKDLRDALLDA